MVSFSAGMTAGAHLVAFCKPSSASFTAVPVWTLGKTELACKEACMLQSLSARPAAFVIQAASPDFESGSLCDKTSRLLQSTWQLPSRSVSKMFTSGSSSRTTRFVFGLQRSVLRGGSGLVQCAAGASKEGIDGEAAPEGTAVAPSNLAVLGVDFGGSGIKGAPVDIVTGQLLKERIRIQTPSPATPEAVAKVVKQLTEEFDWKGCIGVGMPSVVRRGLVRSAANIDKSWINIDARALYEGATGCQVAVLNDADAAGYAEMAFGAGREYRESGVVLMTTFGTGIGTAMFVDGNLVPNLELGHLDIDGEPAEKRASDRAREKEELSWKKWAQRVSNVLSRYEHYLQPDLIIIGGGVSKKDEKFLHLLSVPGGTPIVAASMRNEAGIVGAAIGAARLLRIRDTVHQGISNPSADSSPSLKQDEGPKPAVAAAHSEQRTGKGGADSSAAGEEEAQAKEKQTANGVAVPSPQEAGKGERGAPWEAESGSAHPWAL